ncbi:lytic transglycosylase domain-containing protein [Paracoccus sp. TK19116]|uniref:Lytic transglycosylase domain-containing protein n=1 Tax=Paracoccus albicereus TaxID=2922394 RepID=A0ABT1MVA2_9RHOB|nr:lytic transglycosylase domain-containing protein [Paracoccus albicereus]MCQ0971599.1 lytic transglycosylase domain-containing protein [Paracoccus albicereus]
MTRLRRPAPRLVLATCLALAVAGCDATMQDQGGMNMLVSRDVKRPEADVPAAAPAVAMRWGNKAGSDAWTQATLQALDRHGVQMVSNVPSDIGVYCPGYAARGENGRKAFWAGLLSAVAKHESTYNPKASGGGGKWLGLMQISPATWRSYGCSGEMMNGADNMACAVRIMSKQVGRDNAVAGGKGGWRGVARDWAPMRSASKRADIAAWTKQQSYCSPKA